MSSEGSRGVKTPVTVTFLLPQASPLRSSAVGAASRRSGVPLLGLEVLTQTAPSCVPLAFSRPPLGKHLLQAGRAPSTYHLNVYPAGSH